MDLEELRKIKEESSIRIAEELKVKELEEKLALEKACLEKIRFNKAKAKEIAELYFAEIEKSIEESAKKGIDSSVIWFYHGQHEERHDGKWKFVDENIPESCVFCLSRKYLYKMLDKEGLKYKENHIEEYYDTYDYDYRSIRKCRERLDITVSF